MKKSLLLALIAIVWCVVPVWAVEPGKTANRTEVKTQLTQPTKAKEITTQTREEMQAQRCEARQAKVTFRLNQTQQNRDKHYNLFGGVRKRIAALIIKYEKRGCDVAQLQTDLNKFDSLIAEFAAAFRDFTTSMKSVQTYSCDQTDTKFASATQLASKKNQVVREKSTAVKTFFKNTIQPELSQKVKTCAPLPKPSASPKTSPAIKGVK